MTSGLKAAASKALCLEEMSLLHCWEDMDFGKTSPGTDAQKGALVISLRLLSMVEATIFISNPDRLLLSAACGGILQLRIHQQIVLLFRCIVILSHQYPLVGINHFLGTAFSKQFSVV